MGAAILDLAKWGPPSWTGSDVKNAKVGPILLALLEKSIFGLIMIFWDMTKLPFRKLDLYGWGM